MWTDAESDTDFLNYSEIAEMIAELIADKRLLPLSLGVFGGWGIGKSSTLNLVERQLAQAGDQYLIVKFDAWLYQDYDDARAALMSVISSTLVRAAPPGIKEKAKGLLARVNKLRLLGLAVEGGAAMFGMPTFGASAAAVEAGGRLFAGGRSEKDTEAVAAGVAEAKAKGAGLLRPAEEKAPPEEIDAFRKEFGEVLSGLDKTLVVFIDNLDRCLPANAIHTLEAIRLFLFLPNTAFVIAADEDMVRHAVAEHFKNPGERHITDYLDKLIQMPVFVPRPGASEVRCYLTLLQASRLVNDPAKLDALRSFLIGHLQSSWRGGADYAVEDVLRILDRPTDDDLRRQIELSDRIAPMLAQSLRVNGNPRIVKRLMNVVRMRTSIAQKRGIPLEESVIAKLALFERCTDGSATEDLHHAINNAGDGKPALLGNIERARTEEALRGFCPESWKKHLPVVQDWVRLEPKLSNIDLRPAVYLARETVPLRLGSVHLSPAGRAALEELVDTSSLGSTAAREAVGKVDPAEQPLVMDALVTEMRKNPTWSKLRNDFRGAVVLARKSPEAATILCRFIDGMSTRPKWMAGMLADEPWMKEK